jgi:hypothetical protein
VCFLPIATRKVRGAPCGVQRAVQQQPQQQARVQRMVDTIMAEVGPTPQPGAPQPAMLTRAIMGMRLALHSEVLLLVSMRSKGRSGAVRTGSIGGGAVVEEGRGKRAAKLKVPRYDESPPGAGAKRQRIGR